MSELHHLCADCGHMHVEHIDGQLCSLQGCDCARFRQAAVLCSPRGLHYSVPDVRNFVETNRDLFEPEDVVHRVCPSYVDGGRKNSRKTFFTRAESGLHAITEGRYETWRGWHVVFYEQSKPKQNANENQTKSNQENQTSLNALPVSGEARDHIQS